VTPQNQLHLVGTFPTKPFQIQFEFWFLKLNDGWRIEGISVDAVPVKAVAGGAEGPGKFVAPASALSGSAKPTANDAQANKDQKQVK
jgi:hypothetical protein